jgi:hypothetical protein
MTLKRRWLLSIFALCMMAGLLSPGVVWGGMWAGVQGGWNRIVNTDIEERPDLQFARSYEDVRFDSNLLGGVTIGYDFVKEGFLGRAWPGWMKYFSLVLDATYENVQIPQQAVSVSINGHYLKPPKHIVDIYPESSFNLICISPMIIGKYGFLSSAEIPSGRVQPYLGVGAGLVISNFKINGYEMLEKNKIDMSLILESGLRFMLFRNISLDAACRFRMIPTKFGNSYHVPGDTAKINFDFDPKMYSAILRLAYHF